MKVALVDFKREEHGVQPVLEELVQTPAEIAPSTYYAAKSRPESARTVRDRELTGTIKRVHKDNYGVYSARKVRTAAGWVCAALVFDVFSRVIVGWQVATSLYTDLALDALQMAIWPRQAAGADLVGSSITATAGRNPGRRATPRAWPRLMRSHPLAPKEIPATT